MKRNATMSLGEFREATKDLPDHTCLMVVAHMNDGGDSTIDGGEALAIKPYPFETTLDRQDVYLIDVDLTESIKFDDC